MGYGWVGDDGDKKEEGKGGEVDESWRGEL